MGDEAGDGERGDGRRRTAGGERRRMGCGGGNTGRSVRLACDMARTIRCIALAFIRKSEDHRFDTHLHLTWHLHCTRITKSTSSEQSQLEREAYQQRLYTPIISSHFLVQQNPPLHNPLPFENAHIHPEYFTHPTHRSIPYSAAQNTAPSPITIAPAAVNFSAPPALGVALAAADELTPTSPVVVVFTVVVVVFRVAGTVILPVGDKKSVIVALPEADAIAVVTLPEADAIAVVTLVAAAGTPEVTTLTTMVTVAEPVVV